MKDPDIDVTGVSYYHMRLLIKLAKEGRETPQELLQRLVEKENFSRHGFYDAINGRLYEKTCMSLDCFMKERLGEKSSS